MKKRLFAVLMSIMVVMAMMPCVALADTAVNAYVSVTVSGETKCVNEEVKVTDSNENGRIDIDDAIRAIADKKGAQYESGDGGWGLAILNLWGEDSGSFGYYLNDNLPMNLEETVANGDYISVFVYKDQAYWSDIYTYFTEKKVSKDEGEDVTLTLMMAGYDENWNPISKPYAGADIMEGSAVLGTTDENGEITLSLNKGAHEILSASEKDVIVPAGTTVTINEKKKTEPDPEDIVKPDKDNQDSDADKKKADVSNKDEKDVNGVEKGAEKMEDKSSEDVSTPKTGMNPAPVIVFIISGLGLGILLIRRKFLA